MLFVKGIFNIYTPQFFFAKKEQKKKFSRCDVRCILRRHSHTFQTPDDATAASDAILLELFLQYAEDHVDKCDAWYASGFLKSKCTASLGILVEYCLCSVCLTYFLSLV